MMLNCVSSFVFRFYEKFVCNIGFLLLNYREWKIQKSNTFAVRLVFLKFVVLILLITKMFCKFLFLHPYFHIGEREEGGRGNGRLISSPPPPPPPPSPTNSFSIFSVTTYAMTLKFRIRIFTFCSL